MAIYYFILSTSINYYKILCNLYAMYIIHLLVCELTCVTNFKFIGKKLESIRTSEKQRANEPVKPKKISEPLPLTQTLADFVKKTETKQAEFVEVDNVEESDYKNIVKLDNKTFKDEFRKVMYSYTFY